MRVDVYVALGSNLSDPVAQVQKALQELSELPYTSLVTSSSLYLTKPVGPQDQDDFVNGVARLQTSLMPLELLDELQALEISHRRVRRRHWGPRTLDLDLLLYADQVITHPRLTVPHPEMHRRGFVLKPLMEIAPHLVMPDGTPVKSLYDQLSADDLKMQLIGL